MSTRERKSNIEDATSRPLMKNPKRTTLLINCSVEEAEQIRAAAKRQDRTISALVLRAVMNRIRVERALDAKANEPFFQNYLERIRQPH
jgi:hypothetical protein